MTTASGVRIGWEDLPPEVRSAVERILGAPVTQAVSRPAGSRRVRPTGLPAPAGLPTVRAFQRAQADAVLSWLGEELTTDRGAPA